MNDPRTIKSGLRGVAFVAVLLMPLGLAALWARLSTDGATEPPRAAMGSGVVPLPVPTSPLGRILAALPADTTAVAALRVSEIAHLKALPIDEPGFEGLARIIDVGTRCGIDPRRDLGVVVLAQRMHRLGRTREESDAQTAVFVQGRFDPATFDVCRKELGAEGTVRWLNQEIAVAALERASDAFLNELFEDGPKLAKTSGFGQVVTRIPPGALAWGWMDMDAIRRARPDDVVPRTMFMAMEPADDASIRILVQPTFESVAVAEAIEGQWRAMTSEAPEYALGRRWKYRRAEEVLTATMEVPWSEIARNVEAIAPMIGALK